MFSDDAQLETVLQCLRVSQDALQRDPHQLPAQILGRIAEVKEGALTCTHSNTLVFSR